MDKTTRDKAIQTAVASGDPVAVEWLWDDYADDLFGFLCSFLRSWQDAEDCLQQVFTRLVQKRDRLCQAENLRAYLFQVARNQARSQLQKRPRGARQGVGTDWLVAANSEHNVDLRDQMIWALSQLPEKQRTVLVLKLYSLGPNKEDDNGEVNAKNKQEGDIAWQYGQPQ